MISMPPPLHHNNSSFTAPPTMPTHAGALIPHRRPTLPAGALAKTSSCSAGLEAWADLAADSLGRGMTLTERQNKSNQVWRGYW
ncbi:hypothetical protein TgHK011_004612 [Trichoderma gracile]|nr:hypothetical protein TgHK011_004612 [Trichoderma gracile]